jgi:hypothetical protein
VSRVGEGRCFRVWGCITAVGLVASCSARAAQSSETSKTAPDSTTTSGLRVESSTTPVTIVSTPVSARSPVGISQAPGTAFATDTSQVVGAASATTTTVTLPARLEFVDGKFLGIAQGSPLTFAAEVLGVTPVPLVGAVLDPPVRACTGTPDPWVIRTGGLTLVFEGSSAESAFLTNWTYTGGPVAVFTEMLAPADIRIGDTRDQLEAAYPGFTDYGDEIDVSAPLYLRFGVENNTVSWFGIIDCVFEGTED